MNAKLLYMQKVSPSKVDKPTDRSGLLCIHWPLTLHMWEFNSPQTIKCLKNLKKLKKKKTSSGIQSGLEVIKLEFILRLKIECNDWLLADTCPQAANHCALFWVWGCTEVLWPRGQSVKQFGSRSRLSCIMPGLIWVLSGLLWIKTVCKV